MTTTVPEWLSRRGGDVELASDGKTRFVRLDGRPIYTVVPRPVADKFGSFIMQTNSGRPIQSLSTAADPEAALAAGLEDLRKALGW